MNLLDETLARLADERRVGLMAHLVAGYRTREESRGLALGLARSGADILEIQLPFSDPTADGPTITAACQRALAAGATPRAGIELAAEVAAEARVPVLVMSYFNLIYKWTGGPAGFLAEAAQSGVCGTIVPDVPPEEDDEGYLESCAGAGLHPIVLVSPNVPDARLAELGRFASGMAYATARIGTTGAQSDLGKRDLRDFLGRARRALGVPIAVGFGIRTRAQVESLRGAAEVAVVGTRFLRELEERGKEGVLAAARELAAGRP